MTVTKPALRYHGAKFRLAAWVQQFFPEHTCYVEPFGGAAGVLLQKPKAYAEVYNDLDRHIANFFRILRDPADRAKLIEQVILTPYSRTEFENAWLETEDPIEDARRLCIRAQMGFGSAGATKGSTGFRIDSKRAYGTAMQLWAEYPDSIRLAGERFQTVLVENRPALEVMQQHDAPSTLFYLDPPYVHDTRVMKTNADNRKGAYRCEMNDEMHAQLLEEIQKLSGYVVLSGYDTQLYNQALPGWTKYTTRSRISSGRGTALRNECVWINAQCIAALDSERLQQRMFA